MAVLESNLDTRSDTYKQNRSEMLEKLSQLDDLYEEAAQGGGEEAMERLRSRNKMAIRDRIAWVLDRDALGVPGALRLPTSASSIAWYWHNPWTSTRRSRRTSKNTGTVSPSAPRTSAPSRCDRKELTLEKTQWPSSNRT